MMQLSIQRVDIIDGVVLICFGFGEDVNAVVGIVYIVEKIIGIGFIGFDFSDPAVVAYIERIGVLIRC